ncbi:MAG TPA: SpoIIE family protein phosphatase [Solirubrobacterales bacterium]|jgi:serine phosphatase RsbU (regulator of sigma subunit)/ketosteroid isomerase-like protein|nr:SpoIIE family protein phosphatase [Solirubrobacterales bacterium]
MIELAIGVAVAAFVAMAALAAISLARAKRVGGRFQILDDIAGVADGGGSLEETLDAITAILVPEFGDFCMIDVIEGDGIRRAAVRVTGPEAEKIERGLGERKPALQQRIANAASVARQEPRFFERVAEADLRDSAENEADLEFLLAMGVRSFVTVELRARARPTGLLSVGVSHSGRRFRQDDAHFASVLAGRVALALDNAGLFSELERSERERTEIAETLQRGLLPPPLAHIPGWSVAAMYRPAGAENEIGGDFYDAFRIAGGWMVVIGDVTGRGAQAASVTAHARYTMRTAAALTGDPVVALRTLNRELLVRRGAALCSVVAMAVEEDPRRPLRLAVAGHPAPLMVDGDSVTEASASGPVLGAFEDVAWRIEEIRMSPGQQLVVVTDGVTDAARNGKRFGEQRLHAELVGVSSPALAATKLEGAVHDFTAGELDDDTAIVAIGPASPDGEPAAEEERKLVARLFETFNRRDVEGMIDVCDRRLEFFPIGTAEAIGRTAPYVGPQGLRDYLGDVEQAWEELTITPSLIERRGGSVLVRGRVYARSRELGIRDMPVAWIWQVAGGRFVRGEVFPDPEQAVLRLATPAS